jgi:3-methyladenine DNA glycosylase AlkC
MNELIDGRTVRLLRELLLAADDDRSWAEVDASAEGVDGLQLRARSDLVARAILLDLAMPDGSPAAYPRLAAIVRRALDDPRFTGWMIWPVSEAVATAALEPIVGRGVGSDVNTEHFDDGLQLLAQLTPRLSGEFAIRRFLIADLERALADILPWTDSSDEHVRRLASEGTRAFLPWAVRVPRLAATPTATLPILDALRRDPSDYVRRSVANHLNDLSRDNPALVVQTAAGWLADADENTSWVVRHGLRTLIKKADPGALALLGFAEVELEVSEIELDDETVVLPGELEFGFRLTNSGEVAARLAIDYSVSYVKSNGTLAAKVFKLTTREVGAGETIELRKRHAFRQMTTRVHYAGTHEIELQINGRRYSRRSFELILAAPQPVG